MRDYLKLSPEARFFQNGKELKDTQTPKEGSFTIKLVPGEFTTVLAIIGIVVGIASIVIGIVNLSNLNNTKFPNLSNSQMSLRGSTNSARKTERLPLLLGKHRVYPDVAALPFSSYKDNNQYLHQLFCFGYSDVSIDYSTFKIGETLISYYEDCTYNSGFGSIYPSRVVENVYQLELKNDGTATSIVRSTTSGCRQIEVGLMAPNGLYRYDGEDRKSLSAGVKIEWRVPSGSWITAFEETITENTDKWRKMYSMTPSGSSEGTYEVRITRTTSESGDLQVSDALYLDVIKSFVGLDSISSLPVTAENLQLVALKTKATDQLNGVIDSFNAVCTLNTRAWDGRGSGADHWATKATRNPASAILYLLTNSNANAEPVEDSLIDWASFEDFYAFCEEYGFNCDAWITTDYTVLQLCEFVAASNMAEMVIQCDKISIRVEKAQEDVVQLFTPRNAWDFEMIRSFESKPRNITVSFNDETKGYVQVEREISLDDNGKIVFDSEQEGDSLTVDSFGVTSALHAARLGAQKLKLLYSQTRTYSWKSDIEGIVCLPGDVVLLGNDNFLLGLGEGRIKKILYSEEKISGIRLDARMKMVSGTSYGVRIRTSSSVLDSIPVVTKEGENWELTFQTSLASDIGFDVGDLVAFGELKVEAHKVLITEMTPDQNRSCTFSAVDYSEEAYSQELTVPAYDSGLSAYPPDGGAVGATASSRVPRYAVYGTKGENGLSVKIQYCYSRSLTDPELQNQISWQDQPLTWGSGSLYWNAWQEDTLAEKDGYYIWVRMGLGENPEKWTYSRLTGAIGKTGDAGTPAKVFRLTSGSSLITRNDRLATQGAISFVCDIQGYSDYTPRLTIDDVEQELLYSDGTYYFVYFYPHKEAEGITVKLFNGDTLMDTMVLDVVDETPPVLYLGILQELPNSYEQYNLANGDSCVYDGMVYVYSETKGWKKTIESDLSATQKANALTCAMNDVLENLKDGDITATDYGYFKNLVAGIITAKYIGAQTIELQEGGKIQSEGYEKGNTNRFRVKSNGEAEFYGIKATNATVDGDFTSSGFRTQKATDSSSVVASQTTLNAWDSADFFCKLIDSYNSNYELKRTINNGKSKIYVAPVAASWLGTPINYVGLFDYNSYNAEIQYGSSTSPSYPGYPFGGTDAASGNRSMGAWLIESSVNSTKVIAFYTSYSGRVYNKETLDKTVSGALMYVYCEAVGDDSASVRNSLTYKCLGGYGLEQAYAYKDYEEWKLASDISYLAIDDARGTTYFPSSSVATVGDWSSSNNLGFYYYENYDSLAIPTAKAIFTGTVTYNGNQYAATEDDACYINKDDYGIAVNFSSTSFEIYKFSTSPWIIDIKIQSGIEGIAVKNTVPFVNAEGSLGTEMLQFKEGYIQEIHSSKTWGAKFTKTNLFTDSISSGSTYTLKDDITKYEWITVVGDSNYTRGVITFHRDLYKTWFSSDTRLVISSDSEYLSIYFTSATSFTVRDKSSAISNLYIYGYK